MTQSKDHPKDMQKDHQKNLNLEVPAGSPKEGSAKVPTKNIDICPEEGPIEGLTERKTEIPAEKPEGPIEDPKRANASGLLLLATSVLARQGG